MSIRIAFQFSFFLGILLLAFFIIKVEALIVILKSATDILLVLYNLCFFELLQERSSIPLSVSDEVSKVLIFNLMIPENLPSVSVPCNQDVRLLECYEFVINLLPGEEVAVEVLRSHQVKPASV